MMLDDLRRVLWRRRACAEEGRRYVLPILRVGCGVKDAGVLTECPAYRRLFLPSQSREAGGTCRGHHWLRRPAGED